MKKSIIAAAMAVCMMTVTGASAQGQKSATPKERPTAEQMAQRMTDRMSEKLELTDKQKKEVYDMNLERAKKMEANRAEMQADREKMKKEKEADDAKMKKILTDEQYTQWQEVQKEAAGRMNNRGRGHGPQIPNGDKQDSQIKGKGHGPQMKSGDKTPQQKQQKSK